MSKKVITWIIVGIDVLLAFFFFHELIEVSEKLVWTYYDRGELKASSILSYLDSENYGIAAVLARPGRVGDETNEADEDLYLLGEYADLLYWEKLYAADGKEEAAKRCSDRRAEIRELIAEYGTVMDKMDQSIEKAVVKE